MERELYEQAKQDLVEMIRCPGWQTAKHLLKARLREIESHLATNTRITEPELREKQREHYLLRGLIEQPLEFFMSGVTVTQGDEL